MTSGQLEALFDLMERVNNLEVAATVIGIVGGLLIIGLFAGIAGSMTQTDNLEKAVSASAVADAKLVQALENRVVGDDERIHALEKRIATLEARLKSFAALERLGIASRLGEEMIASADTQVTMLEHEMQEKIDQLRATQRRALEEMRIEMEQYRATMAGLAK